MEETCNTENCRIFMTKESRVSVWVQGGVWPRALRRRGPGVGGGQKVRVLYLIQSDRQMVIELTLNLTCHALPTCRPIPCI